MAIWVCWCLIWLKRNESRAFVILCPTLTQSIMSANALPATVVALGAAGMSYCMLPHLDFLFFLSPARHHVLNTFSRLLLQSIAGFISSISKRQTLSQSEGCEPAKPKLVRRHSSGDHAFLPDQKQKAAINAAKKNFGVPPELVQDREVCVMANDACDAISLS